jgi:acylphosphatase
MFTEVYCLARGKVQGVGYRDFAERSAKKWDIIGSVRNTEEGCVEVIAQASPDTLKGFIEELNEGSVLAKVDVVDVEWRAPTKQYAEFLVLF